MANGYLVDIVLCLDSTGAMGALLEELKYTADKFPETLSKELEGYGTKIEKLRVKVIAYKDFRCDGENALTESKFFSFPEELPEYKAFLENVHWGGGGDIPEDSLEAFAVALKSDWTPRTAEKDKVRQAILIATDAPSHSFRYNEEACAYPEGLPKDAEELARWWQEGVPNGTFSPKAGRLAVLAPQDYPWTEMTEEHNVWVDFVNAGCGLGEVEMPRLAKLLAQATFGQSIY